ncbi:MAG TPA: arylamine N-acetyltransferase [Solirubrobacteraceae bacterium]|nr:arylamine N-acetyltransferase [Solirubrobacteraceae bacterium]
MSRPPRGRRRDAMFDLDAYLERIGLHGRPSLEELHVAHVGSIPFENLDPHMGVPVSLEPGALARKLVAGGRGGYCFEHNTLLATALEALGASVVPMLARVRWGAPEGAVPPRTHLLLRVEAEGRAWHADVGFGSGTLQRPIPFGPGGPHEQSGWRFRVVERGDELVLQTEAHDAWLDVYSYEPRPAPRVDIEMANWYTATHPASRFVGGLIVTTQGPDGTRVALSDWNDELCLTVRTPAQATRTPVARDAIPALLEQRFGLTGFAVDAAGRVIRA